MPISRSPPGRRVYEDPPASPSVQVSTTPITSRPTTTMPSDLPSTLAMTVTRPAPERSRRPPSVHSQRSSASAIARIKQIELEAEERLMELRRKEIQMEAALIKKRLAADVATIREETDRESLCAEEVADTDKRIDDWFHRSKQRGEQPEERYHSPPRDREHRNKSPVKAREKGIDRLADALEKMMRSRGPPRQTQDLPIFTGKASEWLPFKAAMIESTHINNFSNAENLARLRTCLRGEARETVSALLYTANSPDGIMRTLEQCYGRPEVIIDHAFDKMKKLPRLGQSANELNSFAIQLQNIVTSINCIDEKGYLQNPMLTRQVTEKLTPHIRSRWCDYAEEHGNTNEPEIMLMSRFLMREADRAIRHSYTSTQFTSSAGVGRSAVPDDRRRYNNNNNRDRKGVYTATDSEQNKDICFCCGNAHETTKCRKLLAMTVQERWEWAKEIRICFQCLRSKHRRYNCKAKKCGKNECRQAHHALLHEERKQVEAPKEDDTAVIASARQDIQENQALLKVCPVVLRTENGEIDTFALLDEGSTVTLIDEEIAGMIGANGPRKGLSIHGVTSTQSEPNSRVVKIQLKGKRQSSYNDITARTVKNLVLGGQSIQASLLEKPHLKRINKQDVCYANAKPRILVGADNWHLIVTRRLLTGKRNEPIASLTQLGWVIHGSAPKCVITNKEGIYHVHHVSNHSEDKELHELVKSHFEIDSLGVMLQSKLSSNDERAVKIFEETAQRINGRFEVGLPWKSDIMRMPPSYGMALSRLKSIEKKMDKSDEFKIAYTAQMDNLFDKGYASSCSKQEDNEKVWYLPHFAVVNPNKPGKIRMVFDAAAQVNGTCLNDVLLDGPDLLQSLNGILYRFREKPVAVIADIREMFLQVKIREDDRVVQRFLWRGNDRHGPPKKYEMSSMIFGAKSSPFLAHSVRNKNALDHKEDYPLAYKSITENHYMDDWVESFESEDIAEETIKQVTVVHKKASFELAGWQCNEKRLIAHVAGKDRADKPKEFGANTHAYEKTLGIIWIPETDELTFNTSMNRVPEDIKQGIRAPTKREALSLVMSLFDPLGLVSPYTITAKIILQELWRKQLHWDEPIPQIESELIKEWYLDIDHIKNLRINRCYDKSNGVVKRQIHVFCDASEQAYATVAYWRIEKANGEINVNIISGKAKVAPLKTQSIPRLELQASLIGARLASSIVKEHEYEGDVTLWSDSQTVLHWIKNESSKYKPYVAHRITEIMELTRSAQWRWVPTAYNVADDATRIGNTKLRKEDRWFRGPSFLYQSEDEWPEEIATISDENEEVTIAHVTREEPLIDIAKFSSYNRLVRTISYVLRFVNKCKKRTNEDDVDLMKKSEVLLLAIAQKEDFISDIKRLNEGKLIERSSHLLKLDPMIGEDGIIRMNGRINAANVPSHTKNLPILNGKNHLSTLIIRQEHENYNHAGRELLVNNLRQRFWIIRLRPAVKKVLLNCVICKRYRATPRIPVKGDLPKERLTAFSRPFSNCGVDCFGPMWVTIGRRKEKRWGIIFTCLVTRAVHLEILHSLSTDSAIMAMRRMAARRGWPTVMMSDNGTNFRGADLELRNAHKEWQPKLQEYLTLKRVTWKFIDPGAPNQGGAWERLIRSVKNALITTLRERAPKEEVLKTVMIEVENTLNSRPLTHVSVDPKDMEALTPNHFLLGSSTGMPITGDTNTADKRTWRAAQAMANMFWERWQKEYLPIMAPRGESYRNDQNLKVGDVVIVADGLLPRNVWPMGRIESVITGPDKVVRSADVRAKGGYFRRPARRLIVLPIEDGCGGLRRGEVVADEEESQ